MEGSKQTSLKDWGRWKRLDEYPADGIVITDLLDPSPSRPVRLAKENGRTRRNKKLKEMLFTVYFPFCFHSLQWPTGWFSLLFLSIFSSCCFCFHPRIDDDDPFPPRELFSPFDLTTLHDEDNITKEGSKKKQRKIFAASRLYHLKCEFIRSQRITRRRWARWLPFSHEWNKNLFCFIWPSLPTKNLYFEQKTKWKQSYPFILVFSFVSPLSRCPSSRRRPSQKTKRNDAQGENQGKDSAVSHRNRRAYKSSCWMYASSKPRVS